MPLHEELLLLATPAARFKTFWRGGGPHGSKWNPGTC